MRGSAVLNCRDPKIAENMVGYYDEKSNQERVLSLTANEAVSVGYCEGVYTDLKDFFDKEVPGSTRIYPSDDLIELAMSSQSASTEGDGIFSTISKRFLNNLWIIGVMFMYGIYCRVSAENKMLRESLAVYIKNKE
jgi:membrane-bound ClpP family serine protease